MKTVLLLVLLTTSAFGQTNAFYRSGDMVVTVAPSISSKTFNGKNNLAYGYSLEYDYWHNSMTGTGLEIGTYDFRDTQTGYVDHMAVMQSVRLVPYSLSPRLGRFSFEGRMGAETFFHDGTKGLEFGLATTFALTPTSRFMIDTMQHFRANSNQDGLTVRAGLQFKF